MVELIYRPRDDEGDDKDFEFSRLTMEEHWRAGFNDTKRALRHPEMLEHPAGADGVVTFDITSDGRDQVFVRRSTSQAMAETTR